MSSGRRSALTTWPKYACDAVRTRSSFFWSQPSSVIARPPSQGRSPLHLYGSTAALLIGVLAPQFVQLTMMPATSPRAFSSR